MAYVFLLCVGLPVSIVAVRDRSHIDDTWLGKSDVWCASTEHSIVCDDDSVIHVRSAFFNRQKRPSCEPLLSGREAGCGANATDAVVKMCDNRQTCTLTAANHAACPEKPYWLIRVRWECVANPAPEEEHEEQQQQTEEEQVASKVRVEEKVKSEVIDPLQSRDLTVDLIPCFRKTRTYQLLHFNFGRLTTCGDHEGCFKMSFANGKTFEDPEFPPTEEDILEGELITGEDSKWVTWRSIGLVRNDFNTWGVCLPKNQGMKYAITLFHKLKGLRHSH